jgi:hypothetical protein
LLPRQINDDDEANENDVEESENANDDSNDCYEEIWIDDVDYHV